MNLRTALLFLAVPSTLAAQAAVEAAVGASRAVTTTSPAQGVGKGIAGAFDRLNHVLENTGKQTAAPAQTVTPSQSVTRTPAARSQTRTAAVAPPAAPKPEVTYEDASGIQEGLDSAALATRFGPPALKLSGSGQETLCYIAKDGTNLDVTVRNGKVASVQKLGGNVVTLK